MSKSNEDVATTSTSQKKYKGVRRRKWGKWVSEIRVPGTHDRLWLGSYSTQEAAAIAHDVAVYCLRGSSSSQSLNFPHMLPANARFGMSPRSVQKAASDAGMAIDAQLISNQDPKNVVHACRNGADHALQEQIWQDDCGETSWEGSDRSTEGEAMNISVEDYL